MNYNNINKDKLIEILIQKDKVLQKLRLENKKLNYLASTDAMTGLLNRRTGLELLEKEFNMSKTKDKNLLICFADVDRLKMINDTYGHGEGDKILISVAKILQGSIRRTDFVIRMGGDEFLIVFPETTMKEANKAWYRICKRVEVINKNCDNYNLSLSYGFFEYNNGKQKEMSIYDLIQEADVEMYKKKLTKKKEF